MRTHSGLPSDRSALPARVLVDGTETFVVSVADRGLHYGDGLFETHGRRARCPTSLGSALGAATGGLCAVGDACSRSHGVVR